MSTSSDVHLTRSTVLLLLFITVLGFCIAVIFKFPLLMGFLPGLILLVVVVMRQGVSWKQMSKTMMKGVKRNKEVIWLLGLISILLPAWVLSGTVPQLISLTLSWIRPEHFFLLSFLATMVVSMTLGTTVGSLSVIGIPIMGAAHTLHLPLEIAAGAVISGAFIGDRSSPMSSAFQLLANTVEIQPSKQFVSMLPTLIMGTLLTSLFFIVADNVHSIGNHVSQHLNQMSGNGLGQIFLYLPPIVLLVGVLLRFKIRYAFIASLLTAIVMSLLDDVSLRVLLNDLWNGANGIGGLKNMILLILFIALIGVYNEILEEWGILKPLFNRLLTNTSSIVINTLQTVGIAFLVALVAPNQSLPIVLLGRTFLPHWSKHFSVNQLARIMGDTTMLFAGLVPWCLLAIMCSALTGVSVLHYIPFAAFLWIMPIVTTVHSILIRNRKKAVSL